MYPWLRIHVINRIIVWCKRDGFFNLQGKAEFNLAIDYCGQFNYAVFLWIHRVKMDETKVKRALPVFNPEQEFGRNQRKFGQI